jgi:probable phosphoglycerate mutase
MKLIVEADGGSRGNPGTAAGGAVIIDFDSGEVLVEVGVFVGVATNNVAEYRGMIAGLQVAFEISTEAHVHVRMDSKLVVEQMSGNWKIKHENMKGLVEKARNAFAQSQVKYVWVPREDNLEADTLLNIALDAELNQ